MPALQVERAQAEGVLKIPDILPQPLITTPSGQPSAPSVIPPTERPTTVSPTTKPSTTTQPLSAGVATARFLTAAISPVQGAEICSKYLVEVKYQTPEGTTLWLRLNVNSDMALPSFRSKGATKDRDLLELALNVAYKEVTDLTGFASIEGHIGNGEIYMVTGVGVVISGVIEGGPQRGTQSFVATGTWTMS